LRPRRHQVWARINRWFAIGARGSTPRTEVLGGLTTFLTMVYIVFVNPAVLFSGFFVWYFLHGTA
jgi:xanthine/uracil/vitamin C permease (AzgA family)